MADDDNFDIDIYGDDANHDLLQETDDGTKAEPAAPEMQSEMLRDESAHANEQDKDPMSVKQEDALNAPSGPAQAGPSLAAPGLPNAMRQQGTKRKQGEDDRATDPGASAALLISDLQWWMNEEDVRGWLDECGCEEELLEVTFNEHKVNGKSKGQVYVHLQTPQGATALKHQLEVVLKDQTHLKKPSGVYTPAHINPFKTLPKDVPARDKRPDNRSSFGNQGGQGSYNSGNRFNRGGYHRGNMNVGYNNRNFSGPAGGMGMGGGFVPNNMGGFGGNMAGMNQYGNYGRGNMMGGGMRGNMPNRGRGGMMGGGMAGIGGNMAMGMGNMGMPGNMAMPGMAGMGGNMGMMGAMSPNNFSGGSTPSSAFNPGFYSPGAGATGDGNWNPHGTKRPRPE